MRDILFHLDDYVFSYRVAGILLRDDKILLQKPIGDTGYAIPGGHVEFGETNEQTLIREFKEEINADITVGELKWVAEIFFPWGDKPCHQICLYYDVALNNQTQIIVSKEDDIEFFWIPINQLAHIEAHPTNIAELLTRYHEGVHHFIYRE